MNALNRDHNKRIIRFDPQAKKLCRRLARNSPSPLEFGEVLASCRGRDDIVAALCQLIGEKPSYLAIQTAWPWLEKRVKSPCKCRVMHPSVLMTLCHLYDHHVTDLRNWSFTRLVKWARKIQTQAEAAVAKSENQVTKRLCRCATKIRKNR